MTCSCFIVPSSFAWRSPSRRRSLPGTAVFIAAASLCLGAPVFGQASASAAAVQGAEGVVPNLIRYSGTLVDQRGYPVTAPTTVTFSLYAQAEPSSASASMGEEQQALWQESQRVSPNEKGVYTVYLGAATEHGLPAKVFTSVSAQWLGVKAEGEPELAPVLLVSVPYALKAGDAQTLGGLPASAYALAGTKTAGVSVAGASVLAGAADGAPAVWLQPQSSVGVTTPGGTANSLAKFTGSSTIANSEIIDTGTSVGIGDTPNASARLDVNGPMIVRGNTIVARQGNATPSQGFPSYGFDFFSNIYNSATHSVVNDYFVLESEPVGNNTSTPSATFNLLYSNNGAAAAETGFHINPNGTLNFAAGQTFPGTGGITGVTAGTDLSGGGTSGNVTLNLNLPAVQTSLNSVYAQLAAPNNFASSATFAGPITGNSGATQYAIQGNTSSGFGVEGMATGVDGFGIDGYTTGNGGVGVYGNAVGGADSRGYYPIGVLAHALKGYGVKSVVDVPAANQAAVLGQNGSGSAGYSRLEGLSLVSAGAWGDGEDTLGLAYSMGVIGTADTSYAGYFENDSASTPTVYAFNENTGASGTLFKTLMAADHDGACGIAGGNVTCTGQMKTLATTAFGTRQVEMYAMQSPENWMEDFGSGTLSSGRGVVTLDSAFAETVSESADYHVFLTPRGDSKGLYVTNVTPTSFEVHESGGGTASIGFDYRIVAKRRGLEAQRLTDVTERYKVETEKAMRLTAKKK